MIDNRGYAPPRPRTFGQLRTWPLWRRSYYTTCRKCAKHGQGFWSYGVRHHICDQCIDKRPDELMPSAIRADRRENERATAAAQGRAV